MFLGQTKFPCRAQRNSVAHGVSSPPRTIGMAEQNYHALKFFYTSITSNTYFTVLTWNVLEETIFLTIAKLHNVYIFLSSSVGGFPARKLLLSFSRQSSHCFPSPRADQ